MANPNARILLMGDGRIPCIEGNLRAAHAAAGRIADEDEPPFAATFYQVHFEFGDMTWVQQDIGDLQIVHGRCLHDVMERGRIFV